MFKCLIRTVGVVFLFALAGSAAVAQEPNYGYIEGGYLRVDPDDFSGSGDNWYALGSMGLFKNFQLSAKYVSGDYADNVDLKVWQFAGGWHGLLGEKADVVAEATWTDQEIDDDSDDGFGLTAGARWRMVKAFELDGFVHWTDFGDAGSQDSYEARAILDIWRIGLGGSATFSGEDTQYSAFIRFNFDRD